MFIRLVLLATVLLGGAQSLPAETIQLATGEILIGDVQSADFKELTVHITFPSERHLTLAAAKVAPETVYAVLSSRLPQKDATVRLELAEYCLRSGLYAHSIVESRRVARLDSAKETRAREIEADAWEAIASTLLDDAKTHIAIEEPGLARMYLESVLTRYPNTKAAVEAKRLLKKLPPADTSISRPLVTDAKEKDALRAKLAKARKHLEKADKRTDGMRRHFQIGKNDEHLLRRAEPYYRKAYSLLRSAAASATDDAKLNEEIRALAATAREQLCKVYLELGSLYLARGSIKLAEDNCQRACRVEPENQALHGLHQRILDARIALRYGT